MSTARRFAPASVVQRARQGDRRALERFFCTHLPLLRQWARGRVPQWLEPRGDADDFVQLTAIKTLQKLHHLSANRAETIQPYMRQMLLNLVRDEIRKAGRAAETVEIEDHASADMSPMDRLVERANWESYRRALRGVTPRERVAVAGRIERGLSYDELRKELRVPTANAARALVGRAIRHVVALISEEAAPEHHRGERTRVRALARNPRRTAARRPREQRG